MATETPVILNPDGRLLPWIEDQLKPARKTASVWARLLEHDEVIGTLEGRVHGKAGEYLCRGVNGELWPQEAVVFRSKYSPTDVFEEDGWQQFAPNAALAPVRAARVDHSFRIRTERGLLTGKPGDFVVQSSSDHSDIWVVDQAIFGETYRIEQS